MWSYYFILVEIDFQQCFRVNVAQVNKLPFAEIVAVLVVASALLVVQN